MSYIVLKELPAAQQILKEFPLSEDLTKKVQKDRDEIKAIIEGKDDRKILIVGPCSAWPENAVIDFATKLKPIAEKVSDKLKIVLRTYIQKPRTTIGWTGPLNQPDPFGQPDIESGIRYCRQLMIKAIKLGFPLADEALFTHNDGYFVDLLSWVAIGARSAEDQEHRIFASMIDHPVGLKNPTSGNITIGVNSVIAAQYPHDFSFDRKQIKTSGNAHAHLILRGGNGQANCHKEVLDQATQLLKDKDVKNPAILVDISHDNSIDPATGKKDPMRQPQVLEQVIKEMQNEPKLMTSIKGFMAENFILDGNQNATKQTCTANLDYGKSITDGCLGIEKTKEMITKLHASL